MMSTSYQMLWDCEFCGAKKLLGTTHRHCPQCGASQDPEKRYFPPEGEEVEAEGHVFVGADWSCSACETANSNSAGFCTNCGSGKDGQPSAQLVDDSPALPPKEPVAEPTSSGSSAVPKIIGAVCVAAVAFALVFFFWTDEQQVSVVSHSWKRTIPIERFQALNESAWRDKMPLKAYKTTCRQKQRSTKKIPDGETCTTKRVDQGDGTFRKEEQCSPKYREEPVYDSYCNYKIDRWKTHRKAESTGNDIKPEWPVPKLATCSTNQLGCERKGTPEGTYTMHIQDAEGKKHPCDFEEKMWAATPKDTTGAMEFRVIGGGADCSSFAPNP